MKERLEGEMLAAEDFLDNLRIEFKKQDVNGSRFLNRA